jgi:aryl-alcohol dehydrogenase-like predicted oxidoreductase
MSDLIHSGKVIYWGTSEFSADLLREIYAICERYNLYPPQVEQPKYSMLYRENVENNLTPLAQEQGLGLTVFSPLAMGMLTGKYDAGIPEDSRLHREDWAKEEVLSDSNVEKVKALKPIADELRTTRAGLALAWALRNPEVSSLITGATKLSQIEANLKALEVKLTDDMLSQIDGILA